MTLGLAGPDRFSGLSLAQNGTPLLTMSHILISTAPGALDLAEVFDRGNWLSVWKTILGTCDNITGSSDRDVVNKFSGNDLLRGFGGNDALFRGAASDTLNGGAGTDLLDGGAGSDRPVAGLGSDMIKGGLGVEICCICRQRER